jgi:hypothetical protein
MARSKIPDPLKRRHLVEGEQSAAQSLAVAEAYLEQGRAVEALAFLVKAGADDRLVELRGAAVEAGDLFLLRQVATAQREAPSAAEWSALAAAAEASGKELYAADARRQAERAEEQA